MSNPRATNPAGASQKKSRKHRERLIIGAVLGCLTIALLVAGRDLIFGTSRSATPVESTNAAAQTQTTTAAARKAHRAANGNSTDEPPVIDDDGKTLWASPTNGTPLDLAYLSPGAQIIVSMRPAALMKHAEAEKIRAALGPAGQAAIDTIEQVTSMSLVEMERLVVGYQTTSDGKWSATFVVYASKPISGDALAAKLSGATETQHARKKYWLANDRAYYLPGAADNKLLVVAPPDAIHDVIDLGGQVPPLRRDIERLIAHTDIDRQVTIVFAPNSLFSEGQGLFRGQMSRLRGPLFWFLGDELSGAALSLHWDANFFLELIATPTLETSPERAARIFDQRVAQIPEKLEEYVVNLNARPYGRLVVARFPEMVRKLASYTRSGFEKDHAVLRCYLPAVAGHNLLLAAELTFAEAPTVTTKPISPDGAAASLGPRASQSAAVVPPSVQQRLAKITSLKFARDTLDSAIEQLSQDIGVPIVIRGPDLQADGITKNQSFGIDVSNKSADQILIEILGLANPDKTATGPNDARQKLVYVIEQKPDKTEQIVITTRARVSERNDELPAAFGVEKP